MRWSRPVRVGAYGALAYFAIAAVFFFLAWNFGRPNPLGYEWIPLLALATPAAKLGEVLGLPASSLNILLALLLNGLILFFLGMAAEKIREHNSRR